MKAILEFTLPDDRIQFNAAGKADDMAFALWGIIYNLRKRAENEFDQRTEDNTAQDAIDFIFGEIQNELDEHGINIDDLTE